MKEKAKG